MNSDDSARSPRILPLSARGDTALGLTADALATFLHGEQDIALDDVVTTLVHGREKFERRLAVVADEPSDAARALREPAGGVAARRGVAPLTTPRTIFAFTGQGSQYTGMAAGAYASFPEFRAWLDRADTLLRDELPAGLLDCVFKPELADTLARTDVAAAAIAAVQLGLVRVFERYGITPDTVIGHSVGEFCAAAAVGAVDPEDALLLVARRGALMVERTRPGAMLAVRCGPVGSAAVVAALVDETPEVCVAVYNSPQDLVLSGDADALAGIESLLGEAGVRTRRLQVSHAFHSELLDPMADAFAKEVESVAWAAPTSARWISCARGEMTTAPDARYWREHLTEPVRFWDALTLACAGDGPTVLMEIGPHPVLLQLAGQLREPPALVPVLARDQDSRVTVAAAVAEAWCNGVPADLTRGVSGRRRHLPGYGFDRKVHSARPAPGLPAPMPAGDGVAPAAERTGPARSAREVLAEAWTDLLGVEPDQDASFVRSGGDSLILLRLQQRLQASLSVAPSLADLLDAGTFGAMVGLLPAEAAEAPVARATTTAAAPVTSYRPSPVQQGMLLLDLMHQDSNQHNVTVAVEILGRVDGTAMANAFRDAQVRHSALRTVFARRGGEFEAEIRPEPGAVLDVIDAAAAGTRPLDDDEDVREWARRISDPPVRCLGTIPVRGTLVLGPARSLLVVTAHHAVSDATSFGVLVDELAADYGRHRAGLPSQVAPAPVQFHELHAETERAADAEHSADRAYWLEKLAGAPDLVPLPTDRPRPAARKGAGAQWSWHLDGETAAKARALSAELNTTLFSTMLATYAVCLRLRSGADDLSIATPATGRATAKAQRVFGPLLNMVVLRVGVTPGQTFDALVREVRRTVLDALQHSAFPFDRLVAELNPRRDPGRTPLFSVMFTMPDQFGLPAFDGTPSQPVELPGLGAKFDLTLYVTTTPDGRLRLDLEYDPALFDESTVRGFAADYDALLARLTSDPGAVLPSPGDVTTAGSPAPLGVRSHADEPTEAGLSQLESYVARLWSETLEVEISQATDDFFDVGGHSMLVLVCLAEIQDRYPDATIQDFFEHRTVETFAARLEELAGGDAGGSVAVDEPAPAPAAFTPAAVTARSEPRVSVSLPESGGMLTGDVLLTGGAGFLGAHLLATLLRRREGAVVCVVRPRGDTSGADRLRGALAHYAPDVLPVVGERVSVVEADLTELDPSGLGESIAGVGSIVHCAADAKMFGRIEDFRATNVTPTRRLAELALARGWRMAHVSTATAVGAAPGDGPSVTLREDDFDRGERFDNPYSRSKFEAEQVMRQAIGHGLDATVHRIGGLVGDTRAGVFLPDPRGNMLYQMLRAILRCGLVPDGPGLTLNMTPVDFAAAAVLRLTGAESNSGRTFHVLNPEPLTMPGLTGILRDLGYSAILAEPERVAGWLARDGADEADKEAATFLGGYTQRPETVVEYDTRATTEALACLACPPPDLALLRVVIGHGIETGFFPKSRLWDFIAHCPAASPS